MRKRNYKRLESLDGPEPVVVPADAAFVTAMPTDHEHTLTEWHACRAGKTRWCTVTGCDFSEIDSDA